MKPKKMFLGGLFSSKKKDDDKPRVLWRQGKCNFQRSLFVVEGKTALPARCLCVCFRQSHCKECRAQHQL